MQNEKVKILGGFYIYETSPPEVGGDTINKITGVVLIKKIKNNETIFRYFELPEIPPKEFSLDDFKDATKFNEIRDFITRKNDDMAFYKGKSNIYEYTEANMKEFIKKCFNPSLPVNT